MEAKSNFRPFDQVIVRMANGRWKADLYSHYDEQHGVHRLVSGCRETKDILPYRGNEHLIWKGFDSDGLGDGVPQQGDLVLYANSVVELENGYGILGKFERVSEEGAWIQINVANLVPFKVIYFIPLKKYNSTDKDATNREILTFMNGKLTKVYN